MKSEVLSLFHMPLLSIIGLMIFFTFFLSLLAWVYYGPRKPYFLLLAELPLKEDDGDVAFR
ncbi:MAG: hypothetical protein ACO1RX_18450 [Candidatus Sericytochromatia bacterium]